MTKDFAANSNLLPHQERVNIEIFKAIETLGRKIERADDEHTRQSRRLALIESSTMVDEKTGKLSLPVALGSFSGAAVATPAAKWPVMAIFANTAMALFTLGVVLFQQAPAPVQTLTPRQLAALNALANRDFAELQDKSWKKIEEAASSTPVETNAVPPPMPSAPSVETAQNEIKPVVVQQEKPDVRKVQDITATVATAPASVENDMEKDTLEQGERDLALDASTQTDAPAQSSAAPSNVDKAAPASPDSSEGWAEVKPDTSLPSHLAALEKRAFQNVPEAQHDLATIYASGKVVAQDYKRAAYWFSKAADKGVANADYNLGVMFQQGLGVKADLKKAIGWYDRAAQLGHPEAMYNLGIAYIEGVGVSKDVDKGVAYFKSAANAGVAQAAFNLGVLYESKFAGAPDTTKALQWYQVAANDGHADAKAAVRRLTPEKADNGKEPEGQTFTGNNSLSPQEETLTVADLVEPAAAFDDPMDEEENQVGEGDSSPVDSSELPPPAFRPSILSRIQAALISNGLLPKGADTGAFDSRTSDAIRAWQKKTGLTEDGQPSETLLEKMTK